jgi:hypothetical protein
MFHSSDPIQWGFRARPEVVYIEPQIIKSMDWFKGKSTGNHRFSHEIRGFPVNFPLNQSIGQIKNHQKSHWWIVLTPFFLERPPNFLRTRSLVLRRPWDSLTPSALRPKTRRGSFQWTTSRNWDGSVVPKVSKGSNSKSSWPGYIRAICIDLPTPGILPVSQVILINVYYYSICNPHFAIGILFFSTVLHIRLNLNALHWISHHRTMYTHRCWWYPVFPWRLKWFWVLVPALIQ